MSDGPASTEVLIKLTLAGALWRMRHHDEREVNVTVGLIMDVGHLAAVSDGRSKQGR